MGDDGGVRRPDRSLRRLPLSLQLGRHHSMPVETQNSFAVTSAMLGAFRNNARTRMEFLELIKQRSARMPLAEPTLPGFACVGDD